MNLASYQLLQPAMYAAYLHRRAAFKMYKFKYNKINYFFGGDGGLEPPSHDDKNGII